VAALLSTSSLELEESSALIASPFSYFELHTSWYTVFSIDARQNKIRRRKHVNINFYNTKEASNNTGRVKFNMLHVSIYLSLMHSCCDHDVYEIFKKK